MITEREVYRVRSDARVDVRAGEAVAFGCTSFVSFIGALIDVLDIKGDLTLRTSRQAIDIRPAGGPYTISCPSFDVVIDSDFHVDEVGSVKKDPRSGHNRVVYHELFRMEGDGEASLRVRWTHSQLEQSLDSALVCVGPYEERPPGSSRQDAFPLLKGDGPDAPCGISYQQIGGFTTVVLVQKMRPSGALAPITHRKYAEDRYRLEVPAVAGITAPHNPPDDQAWGMFSNFKWLAVHGCYAMWDDDIQAPMWFFGNSSSICPLHWNTVITAHNVETEVVMTPAKLVRSVTEEQTKKVFKPTTHGGSAAY
jgi:hypothetical protein